MIKLLVHCILMGIFMSISALDGTTMPKINTQYMPKNRKIFTTCNRVT